MWSFLGVAVIVRCRAVPPGHDPTDEATTSVEYQVKSPATPSTICVLGQVPATAGGRTERLIDDIARMVSTITVFAVPSD